MAEESSQGRSDGGGYRDLYPPKSAKVNFLWGKMTSERLFNSFIHPQKLLYPPKNKFLATPLERILPFRRFPHPRGRVRDRIGV